MEYRPLSADEIADTLNPLLLAKGWAALNVNPSQPTCYVLGAWEGSELVEAFAFQLYPVLGPLLRVAEGPADGKASRELARRMQEFLEGAGARGYLTIADSPVTERLCKRFGMALLESKVYSFVRKEEKAASA
jgi:hypothetical protein